MSASTIRNTLKSIEENVRLRGIIRCHRSYMVNKRHIKIFEKQKDSFVVKIDTPDSLSIPVSKNYVADVFELFEA